jgi:hypothetical protein
VARSASLISSSGSDSQLAPTGSEGKTAEVTPLNVDDFVRLEREVWEALLHGDPAADARMLSDDFLGVYPSGFADRQAHVAQLTDGPTIAAYEITEPHVMQVSNDAVLLSYRAVYRRPATRPLADEGVCAQEVMYVSSLWNCRDGRWINVFSQDTPAV